MEYEEILEELQAAIRGLEMNTVFLLLFTFKYESLKEDCPTQTLKNCKAGLLNFAEQYTRDYLSAAKLLINFNKEK